MNFSLASSPKFVFVLISRGFAFGGSLLTNGLTSHGFGAGRVTEPPICIQCHSFFFIFTFGKSIYKSCKFADLGFQVINVISLVLLFVGTSVLGSVRGSEVGSALSLQDSFVCLLTFGLVRNHGC